MMMVEIGAQAWVLHAFVPLGPSWTLVLTTGPPFCPYSILRLFKELNLQVAEVSPFLILWWLVLVIRYLQKLQNPLGYLSLISCTIRAPLSYGVCFITLKECSVSCNETPTGPDQAPVCRAALKCFCALKCTKKKSALALLLQSVYRVCLSLSPFFYFLIILISFPSVCLSLCFRDWCPSACTASPQLVLQLPPVSMKAHYCLLLVHYYCWQRSSNCPDS